ncbi:twin-arginine translocase TatA/TatE family subunit [Olsenella sp. DSM 107455]|uniref:Sec-independent protein translocase protein TatA n=1 Tax=Thermophilibacter gallinarum TaxID=2779357 RepID=A0ABR9QTD0_9ACTN|nr:twin-arginine translocase TatA/TatE family subunit [Thermophilibacter gallinarum]
MFGIGEGELVLIVLFAFLVFGPDKLPGMGRTLGRALRQFKSAQEGFTEVVQTNIVDPAAEALSDSPKKPTRNRAAELDEDADLDAPEGEDAPRPKRAETFAERKKRLAEEKAAREAAEAAAAAESDADAPEPAEKGDDSDVATGEAADEPQPAKPSLADLYAMTSSSRPRTAGAGDGDSPVATHEVSEARSAERGADGADPASGAGTDATDDEKEA